MKTAAALPHLTPGADQGVGEGVHLFLGLAQQVQGQALGRAGSDPRKALELIDQPRQGPGEAAQESAATEANLGARPPATMVSV